MKKLITSNLILLTMCLSVKAQTPWFFNNNSVGGYHLFSQGPDAAVNNTILMGASSVTNDPGGTNIEIVYGVFGPVLSNYALDAEVSQDSPYYGVVVSGFPSNTEIHSGISGRFAARTDFAGMVLLNVSSNDVQIIDRIAGVEHVSFNYGVPLSFGTHYRIKEWVTNGNTCSVAVYSSNLCTLLFSTNYTFTTGVPSAGQFACHTFDAVQEVFSYKVWDQNGNLAVDGGTNHFMEPLNVIDTNGVPFTNGVAYLNSTGWKLMLLPAYHTNAIVTGALYVNTGGFAGITFRCDTTGHGYHWGWDNTAQNFKLYSGRANAPATVLQTWTGNLLCTCARYPFTLTFNGSALSLTINGNTMTFTDSTFSKGWAGVIENAASAQFDSIITSAL